ncbi:uncharacterized protein LOC143446064 isoform X3 [Clavelina lepadiformis]|uniref:uncharacterized protein LOC143446064 isoform X3 n=1 Tax=Clavelina lepadiformis TaxID=159417 RepID=UPI004041D3B0
MSDLVAEKEEVRKVIRSLLISAPNGLTPSQLESDYKAMMSNPIPYRKFGFFNVMDFARSLTDVLYIALNNNQLVFHPIANNSTKHILKMVQKQKNSKQCPSLLAPAPRGKASSSKQRPRQNVWPSAFLKNGILRLVKAHPDGISLTKLPDLYKDANQSNLEPEELKNIQAYILKMPDVARLEYGRKERNGNNLYIYPAKSVLMYKNLVENKVILKQSAATLASCQENNTCSSNFLCTTTAIRPTMAIKTITTAISSGSSGSPITTTCKNSTTTVCSTSVKNEVLPATHGSSVSNFQALENVDWSDKADKIKKTATVSNREILIPLRRQQSNSHKRSDQKNRPQMQRQNATSRCHAEKATKHDTAEKLTSKSSENVKLDETNVSVTKTSEIGLHAQSSEKAFKPFKVNASNRKTTSTSNPSNKSCSANSFIKKSNRTERKTPSPTLSDLGIFEADNTPSSRLLQEEIVDLLADNKTGMCVVQLPTLYKMKYNKELDLHKYGYFSVIEFVSTMSDRVSMCRVHRSGDWILKLRCFMNDSENGDNTDEQPETDNRFDANLKKVENDLKELLKRFKGGIVLKSLEDIYQMHYSRNFPYKKLGLPSIESLICRVADKLVLANGDICLQSSSASEQKTPAAPSNEITPIDAVGSGVCYKPPTIPTQDWGYFDCFVSYVASPGSFMIQVIGEETTCALDELMDELERVYTHPIARSYKMPSHLAHIGQVCATIFHGDNNWNRAIITEEPRGGFVKVLFVDYGDMASVPVNSLFLLKSKFLDLPAIMIRARLAHLKPADMETWDFEAKKVMLDICRDKALVASVTDVDSLNVVSLLLCDTSQSATIDVFVNDVLIEKELATLVRDDAILDEREEIRRSVQEKLQKKKPELATPDHNQNYLAQLPLDLPPPYQATEPELCDGKSETSAAHNLYSGVRSGSNPHIQSYSNLLKIVPPPPGFNHLNPDEVSNVYSDFNQMKPVETRPNWPETVDFSQKQNKMIKKKLPEKKKQKRFLRQYKLADDHTIHVINYEGNALLSSGEISHLFRPLSGDLLAPLLLVKSLSFPELVLSNDEKHRHLFAEFNQAKVKGTFSKQGLKSLVSLFRLSDVPMIIEELGHNHSAILIKAFQHLFHTFVPDESYWFCDKADLPDDVQTQSIVGRCVLTDESTSVEMCSKIDVSSECIRDDSQLMVEPKNHTKCCSEVMKTSLQEFPVDESRKQSIEPSCSRTEVYEHSSNGAGQQSLIKQRDTLLDRLVKEPSTHLFNELECLIRKLNLYEKRENETTSGPNDACKKANLSRKANESHETYNNRVDDEVVESMGVIPEHDNAQPLENIFAPKSDNVTAMKSFLNARSPPFQPTQSTFPANNIAVINPLGPKTVSLNPCGHQTTIAPTVQPSPFRYCYTAMSYLDQPCQCQCCNSRLLPGISRPLTPTGFPSNQRFMANSTSVGQTWVPQPPLMAACCLKHPH